MTLSRRGFFGGLISFLVPATHAAACHHRRGRHVTYVHPRSLAVGAVSLQVAAPVFLARGQRAFFQFVSRNTNTYYTLLVWTGGATPYATVPGIPFSPGFYVAPPTPTTLGFTALGEAIPGKPESAFDANVTLEPHGLTYLIYITHGVDQVTLSMTVG